MNLKLYILTVLMRLLYLTIGMTLAIIAAPATTRQIASEKSVDIREVVTEAKAAALSIKNDFQRGLILDEIGAAAAKSGDLDTAVDIATRAYPNTMSTLRAIGEELFKGGDLERALAIASKLPGDTGSTVICFFALAQAREGNLEAALKTVEAIHSPEVRSDALREIAARQAVKGDFDGARKSTEAATVLRPPANGSDEDALDVLVEAQIERGEINAAHQSISTLKDPEMRAVALISSAATIATKGNLAVARDWLTEARRTMPSGEKDEFFKYFAIPVEISLGLMADAMHDAESFDSELRAKGFTAIAVSCAEKKDFPCMRDALDKMRSTPPAEHEGAEVSNFAQKLSTLNVTAALIDAGEFDQANEVLSSIGQNSDFSSKSMIEPEVQLQHVFALAQQGKFDEARALALTIKPDSIADAQRGTALRTVAVLETKKLGPAQPRQWASALSDSEDRAYALLGIAQQLLGIGDVHVPYSAIQIH